MKPTLIHTIRRHAVPPSLSLATATGLLMALAACVQVPENVPTRVELPPFFTHNLVLQQGTENILWGFGPPGRPLWVQYKGLSATCTVPKTGRWQVKLDLSDPRLPHYPTNLLIGVGKPGQNLVVALTNVAVGNVWLLGVCDGKGLSLAARGGQSNPETWDPERIRFLTLTNLAALRERPAKHRVVWQPCSPESLDPEEISVLSFHLSFGLGAGGYVGVIQTSTNDLVRGLLPHAAGGLSRQRLDQLSLGVQGAWGVASNAVRQAEIGRQAQLNELKQLGVVSNIPPVFHHDFPAIHARSEFAPKQPPAAVISFEGAIW